MMKKKEKKILMGLLIACIFSILALGATLIWYFVKLDNAEFIPPEPDPAVIAGIPEKTIEMEKRGWVTVDGSEYTLSYTKYIYQEADNSVKIWFYNNPESENAWLKLRVKDGEGKILAETGLVKPGEYIESVQLSRKLKSDDKIVLEFMGYEAESYHSLAPHPAVPIIVTELPE